MSNDIRAEFREALERLAAEKETDRQKVQQDADAKKQRHQAALDELAEIIRQSTTNPDLGEPLNI